MKKMKFLYQNGHLKTSKNLLGKKCIIIETLKQIATENNKKNDKKLILEAARQMIIP